MTSHKLPRLSISPGGLQDALLEGYRETPEQAWSTVTVKISQHLTDEALLLQAGKRLTATEDAATRAHLNDCADCRARFNQTRVAHAVLVNLSDLGLDEVRQRSHGARFSAASAHGGFPFLPIGGVLVASALLLVILFASPMVTDVRASELLDNAVAKEGVTIQAQSYSVRVDGISCATMRGGRYLAHVARSPRCDNALAHIHDTVWSKGNPLSAAAFRNWRNSLSHRHDALHHKSSGWALKTNSESGSVRFASLDLREADLKPTELTIHFADE